MEEAKTEILRVTSRLSVLLRGRIKTISLIIFEILQGRILVLFNVLSEGEKKKKLSSVNLKNQWKPEYEDKYKQKKKNLVFLSKVE